MRKLVLPPCLLLLNIVSPLAQISGGSGTNPVLFPMMGSQASSVYPWATSPPGVTYNGGIPNRTTQCGPTLTPLGNGRDDTPQIQAAINACRAGQHVQLGQGAFMIGNGSNNTRQSGAR
jgi:hypothetical protein